MRVGYARVSTDEQKLDMQIDALEKAGCTVLFTDTGHSGKKKNRPGLDKCLASLKPGDILVVYKLDRLFRSVVHFAAVWQEFKRQKIDIISLTQGFDTSSSNGRLMMNILSSFAEFESDIISERTASGMQAAKKRGVIFGRKEKWRDEEIIKGSVPRATFYRRRKVNK